MTSGFEILSTPRGVHLHATRWSAELEEALREQHLTHVSVTGWKDPTHGIAFLARFAAQLRELWIDTRIAAIGDLQVLQSLTQLEHLSARGPVDAIDFRWFPGLRHCSVDAANDLGNLGDSATLEELVVGGVPLGDLSALRPLKTLRTLSLGRLSRLRSLDGLEDVPLDRLSVSYLPQLRSVSAISGSATLRKLLLERVPNVEDVETLRGIGGLENIALSGGPPLDSLEWLGDLQSLQVVMLDESPLRSTECSVAPLAALPALERLLVIGHRRDAAGFAEFESLAAARTLQVLHLKRVRPLRSLEFLRPLAELRSFMFERSEIVDGDLSVLLALPKLTHVRISPRRKHYSQALDEIDEHLRRRLPPGEYKPRPPWRR